ncbi:MAG: hypothetical protein WBB74_12685 [Gaiellaceae bacterium]
MTALAQAAKTFEQTLEELGITGREREVDPSALGRRGALLAASDVIWHKHLGPMYSSKQVRELMGRGSRQSVSELAKRRRLLALPEDDGRLSFPAFQFGRNAKRLPGLERILDVFKGAVETPYTIASWFVTPERRLDGKTPAAWLRAGRPVDPVLEAATRYAERLRR